MKKTLIVFIVVIFISLTIHSFEAALETEIKNINNLTEKLLLENNNEEEILFEIISIGNNLIKKYSDIPEVYWEIANIYIDIVHYYEIENYWQLLELGEEYAVKLIEITPDSAKGYYLSGIYLGQIGEKRGILNSLRSVRPMRDLLEKAIQLEPDFAPAYDVLARLYFEAPGWPLSIGSANKALEYRIKSVELEPDNVNYQWELYNNYVKVNKLKEAAEVMKTIIEMTADN